MIFLAQKKLRTKAKGIARKVAIKAIKIVSMMFRTALGKRAKFGFKIP